MKKASPQQEKALSYIEGLCARKATLPCTQTLASMAGVSYVTMWKALSRFRQNHPNDLGQTRLDRPMPRCKWERIRAQIEHDIIEGIYRSGATLPSIKELCAHYGCTGRTMKKAVDALQRRGRLLPHNRGFRLSIPSSYAGSTILLIAQGHSYGEINEVVPGIRESIRALESACQGRRLTLRTEPVFYRRGSYVMNVDILDRKIGTNILGYVLWTEGLDSGYAASLIQKLAVSGKPVAVQCDARNLPLLSRTRSPVVRFFLRTGDYHAGRETGEYLLMRGHRHVAYISPFHDSAFSLQRFQGLRDAFTDAQVGASVQAHVCPGTDIDDSRTQALRAAKQQLQSTLFAFGPVRSGTPRQLHRLMNLRMRVMKQIDTAVYALHLQQRLNPLMARTLEERRITAWVAATADTGIECVCFLQDCRKRVPRDISVLCFEDTLDTFTANVASYNLNTAGLMHAMTDYILQPHPLYTAPTGRHYEARGFIIPRTTVGDIARR